MAKSKNMTKQQLSELNALARQDFNRAVGMLEGINFVLGTKYGWINKRVVLKSSDGKYHDAWAIAD